MTEVAYLRKLGYRLERRVTLYTEGRSPSRNARHACLTPTEATGPRVQPSFMGLTDRSETALVIVLLILQSGTPNPVMPIFAYDLSK